MLLCILCTKLSLNNINLLAVNGQKNYEYEVTTRYFDPKLLNSYNNLNPKSNPMMICEECWQRISNFYDFQQMVQNSHAKLEAQKDSIQSPKDKDSVSSNSTSSNSITSEGRCSMKLQSFEANADLIVDKSVETNTKNKPSNEDPDRENKVELTNKSDAEAQHAVNLVVDHDDSPSSNYDSEDNSTEDQFDKEKRFKKTKEYDDLISEWKYHLDCYVCGNVYSNLAKLRQHFRETHPQQKCYITCCQRKLCYRFQIVEHIRLHINPNAFKCDICGKCNSDSRGLKQHKKEKHTKEGQEKRFECNICQKRFAKKGVLKNHMDTHVIGSKDHICKECGKGFVLASRLKIHERTVHNVDRVCDQCGKTIHGEYALKQHLLEHNGIKKRKWPCEQCDAQLNSHSSLKRHREAKHQQGNTVYVCLECGKVAPSQQALTSHTKYVHQAVRKYKCNICDKAFKVAIVLREHMAIHTGEDLYKCPHCPKTFKVNSNMHHHRKKAHPIEWQQSRSKNKIIDKLQ